MTKPCKSCKEQIDQAATKCPKCQAYQQWYRNPQMLSLVLLIPFMTFVFWNTSRIVSPAGFADYKDKVTVSVVDEKPSTTGKTDLVTIRIENRTNKTWKRPKFQIESLDGSDKVLSVEHVNEYNMVVAPNSSVLDTLSLRIIPPQPVAKWRVTLTDIDSSRF
ncbi:MAG: hypothetical protein QOI04_94 [Verrucomicrobiota bacterium]|jgi:hypothetical protein